MALTVAVTGANGFVGSHVCAALLAQGHKVRACVRDPHDSTKTAHLQALPGAEGALTLFTGDLMLEGSYDEAFSVADAVVHTAAVVEVLDKGDPENKIVKPAVTGSLNVLASVRRSPSVARLVYLSSVAAVQSASGKPDEHLYTEADWNDFSTVDSDAYGYAKTTAERMLWRECASAEGGRAIELVTLCPGVILGPCLTKAHTKASTVLIREVIYGNAMQCAPASRTRWPRRAATPRTPEPVPERMPAPTSRCAALSAVSVCPPPAICARHRVRPPRGRASPSPSPRRSPLAQGPTTRRTWT